MNRVFEIIGLIIEKLKIKEVVISLMVSSVVILFASDKVLNILGLLMWRNKYRSYIGATLLICVTLCLIWFISEIGGSGRNKRIAVKYLKRTISRDEIQVLIDNFYNSRTREFKSSGILSMASGYTTSLAEAFIIYQATNIGHNVNSWAFNMYPYARIFLNNAIKRKKIIIGDDGQWKL